MKKNIILLIEDDELDTISVKRSLKKVGGAYELHTAFNGNEALALIKNEENPLMPDIILLDLSLPKMNGLEFLRIIRSEPGFNPVKVFIITTSTGSAERENIEELGVSGYFIKPLSYLDNTKKTDSMDSFFQFHLRKILAGEHEH